ncbi:pimeloyl-ACP methyl ester carboxylesterase [Peribacillus deserti]|uniref:Pimeloyl-ACP methyl ester carboxylesterase n=1 Tax=Peribacillus deserti TaxID=673318 RepID=A0ABS2QNW6_9BACI|nr:alpha/beta hydrolase [Peribacillus deserti]MBM7694399.1 pimeloyl-ACP methyl ester carboxylesterase [Peribacillus deserti]
MESIQAQKVMKGQKKIFGNEIYYEYYQHPSSTTTILLLHGFLSSTFSFRKLIPYAARDYNIISVDLPPFGNSGKSNKYIYSHKNHSRMIIELLKSLDIKEVILTGHSMGGQTCLNIMKDAPELAAKGVLLCSSGYLKKSSASLTFTSRLPFFHLFVKRRLAKTGIEKNLQNVVFNHSLIDQEMVKGYMEPFLNNEIFKGLTKMIREWEGDLSQDDLKRIETPCLLLWGEHDKVVSPDIGRRLHADLPNSSLKIFEGAGHLLPEEEPEKVYSCMKEFIEAAE